MNTGTPSTGLKHAQFLVNLYLSYMGHDWAHHRWRLFLKNERKITTGKGFFCSFVHIFFYWWVTGGWYHSYGRKRVLSLYLLRQAVYGASAPVELLVAEDACTSRGGDQGQTDVSVDLKKEKEMASTS